MNTSIPMPRRHWLVRLILPLTIVVVAAALLIYVGWTALRPATNVHAITVVVRPVETTEISTTDDGRERIIQAPGWVEADPFSVYVGALIEGVVEDVLVLEGDRVAKDQPVAQLIRDDAAIALQRADADLSLSKQQLASAHAQLATITPAISAADARRRALVDEHARKSKLVETGAVAEGPVTRLAMTIEAAEAEIAKLRARETMLAAEVGSAKASVDVAEAIRADAELALERTTVRSPIDGIVMERLMSPGSVIRFGPDEHSSHVVHVYDPSQMQVRADVPLAEASGVSVGHPAEIIVDVLPDRVFTGNVTRFVHRADLQKNTVEAKIHIDDPSGLIKPDMLARVRILQPQQTTDSNEVRTIPRVFVPQDAVLDGGEVLVITNYARGGGTAAIRSVRLGDTDIDGWIEVLEGLSPGDRVILDGERSLDGSTVQIDTTEKN
ncbi:MAG TPA: hypothetical protein DEO92_09980 [Phycisphaerales bacterium]|nr:hypothetical protein [Phycisphaerales bacterium]